MTAAYVLLLTFALGNSQSEDRSLTCASRTCVAHIINQASQSPAVSRLRVFLDKPVLMSGGSTVFPPILDLRFQ